MPLEVRKPGVLVAIGAQIVERPRAVEERDDGSNARPGATPTSSTRPTPSVPP